MAAANRSTAIGAGLAWWLIAVDHASRHVFITLEDHDIARAARVHVDDLLKRKHWLVKMPADHVQQARAFADYTRSLRVRSIG